MTDAAKRRRSFVTGYLQAMSGKPLPISTGEPVAYLKSADGYALQDSNGLYLIPKEGE